MTKGRLTDSEWRQLLVDTVANMASYVAPFTTPISKVISHGEGEHLATGTYCNSNGKRFLVTNSHVAEVRQTNVLATKLFGYEEYFRIGRSFLASGAPIDVAAARVEDAEWNIAPHRASAVPAEAFAQCHQGVEGELFFIAGYSGERARFNFNYASTPGTPYLAQECSLPEDPACTSEFHFALGYNPAMAWSADPKSKGLPAPPGLSGSLVWNTRRLQRLLAGQSWSPVDAQVTGIVWGWRDLCLLATKIEQLNFGELFDAADAES